MERRPRTPDPLGRFQRNQYPESDWDRGLRRRARCRPQPTERAGRLVELHPDSGATSSNPDRRPLHVLTVTIAIPSGKFPPLLFGAPGRGHSSGGESPLHTQRGDIARWNLEEAEGNWTAWADVPA